MDREAESPGPGNGAGRVVVVGGGLGGLSAAIHLRAQGWEVDVVDRAPRMGGKCNVRTHEGFHFDTGPSLVTLPGVLEKVFAAAGERMEDYLQLERLDPAVRYFFADGMRWDAPGSLEGWEAAVARDFPADFDGWRSFMENNRRLWEVSGPIFLEAPLDWKTPLRVPYAKAIRTLGALRPQTMSAVLERHFRSPHLLQLYKRYATYNGSDPDRTPSTFNVIAYAEAAFGSWHVRGGIYRLVEALVALAERQGVRLHTGRGVERLLRRADGRRVRGLVFTDGENWEADAVVVNMDAISALGGSLFAEDGRSGKRRRRLERAETSVSGYVLLLALDREVPGLSCHNIFFNEDYGREFREIFREAQPLSDPTLYVHAPGKVDSTLAPTGREGWFVLANAPPLDRNRDWPDSYADRLLGLLEERLGRHGIPFSRDWVTWKEARAPAFFEREYGAWQGSLYGLSSNGMRQAFLRVPNRAPWRNVAFAGGSAHPGGGIPLVLTSGRLAAEKLGAPTRSVRSF